ncbi:MAG TPA: Asp23/Gls24 family envelope stress response protein [Candidatus Choladousia intestinavium]|uniref:Asp23/Gls24 family envelope stress response protein n=1 Tax=Candidatus Choladousia intestinavium TaxID=2840727 RepID=A0A9D1D9G6_9FIRM|nr:Asp23/Gls24 family envelope stress response protein [Candidatus Choladousia intestinavium]
MENTEIRTHKLENEEKFGEVRIADEVVAIIAGLAASEVEGVASMAGNVTRDLISKLGMKSLSKGVKITMDEDTVHVALAINIRYGYNVPTTCQQIQEKVKTAIETMTGLNVAEVNVKIVNVTMEKDA